MNHFGHPISQDPNRPPESHEGFDSTRLSCLSFINAATAIEELAYELMGSPQKAIFELSTRQWIFSRLLLNMITRKGLPATGSHSQAMDKTGAKSSAAIEKSLRGGLFLQAT
ncbi:MAG: hypothetical protein L0Y60_09345 [Beijerinckiaceae bacterium]|nr:hypothetical protein [Beijerinckiaceae bacterium]